MYAINNEVYYTIYLPVDRLRRKDRMNIRNSFAPGMKTEHLKVIPFNGTLSKQV